MRGEIQKGLVNIARAFNTHFFASLGIDNHSSLTEQILENLPLEYVRDNLILDGLVGEVTDSEIKESFFKYGF